MAWVRCKLLEPTNRFTPVIIPMSDGNTTMILATGRTASSGGRGFVECSVLSSEDDESVVEVEAMSDLRYPVEVFSSDVVEYVPTGG
jgi:hypothetical protein